jgi:acyl-CoA oxidase
MRVILPGVEDASENAKMTLDDAKTVQTLLEHDNHKNRRKIETLVQTNPIFNPYYNLSLDEMREYAIRRLRTFCQAGILSVQDFERNPSNVYTCHEAFGMVDGSFATKMTVQFNLFGG